MMKTVQIAPLTTLKERAARLALGLGLATTLAFGAVLPASADTGTGTVVINPGTQSVSISDFAFQTKELTGATQTTTATPTIAVVDPTGSSAGWDVTMSATAFTDGGTPAKTLVAAPRVTAAPITNDNAGGSAHTNGVSYAGNATVEIDGAGGTIATSAAGASSNGTFTLTPTIEIDIPYNTEQATYTSTITVTIGNTP